MPALSSDIGAATREAATAAWQSAVGGRYPSARDGSIVASTGYFDRIEDAQAVVDARGGLIGVERKRFAVNVDEIVWPDLTAGVPSTVLIDVEHGVNSAHLEARIEVDLEPESTGFELYG